MLQWPLVHHLTRAILLNNTLSMAESYELLLRRGGGQISNTPIFNNGNTLVFLLPEEHVLLTKHKTVCSLCSARI